MFNKKILNKYLTNLDEIEVSQAFGNLSDFKSSIKNIKDDKFLLELQSFVDSFGMKIDKLRFRV